MSLSRIIHHSDSFTRLEIYMYHNVYCRLKLALILKHSVRALPQSNYLSSVKYHSLLIDLEGRLETTYSEL